jgi:anti-sigma factor RsiW
MGDRHVPGGQLSAFLDDELRDERATTVARHVAGCDRCFRDLQALRTTRAALRDLPRLQAPVLATGATPVRGRPSRRARVVAILCALPVLLAGAAYAVGGDRAGEVVPPVERFLVEHVARAGGAPVPPSVLAPPAEPSS